jgi:hypothetical protein
MSIYIKIAHLDTQPIPIPSHLIQPPYIDLHHQHLHFLSRTTQLTSLTQPLLSFVNGPARNDKTELLNWKSCEKNRKKSINLFP